MIGGGVAGGADGLGEGGVIAGDFVAIEVADVLEAGPHGVGGMRVEFAPVAEFAGENGGFAGGIGEPAGGVGAGFAIDFDGDVLGAAFGEGEVFEFGGTEEGAAGFLGEVEEVFVELGAVDLVGGESGLIEAADFGALVDGGVAVFGEPHAQALFGDVLAVHVVAEAEDAGEEAGGDFGGRLADFAIEPGGAFDDEDAGFGAGAFEEQTEAGT